MITNANVLRLEQLPRDLYHREGQLDHLSSVLDPTSRSFPENVCIFGPSGAGKTTIAKYTLNQLEREALDLRWAYVNCMTENTSMAVLYRLVREAGLGADLTREGTPMSEILRRIRESDKQLIAVLDEVAVLDEQPLIALWEIPNVSLVCITIDEAEWFAGLSSQAQSRLQSAATVQLDKYSHSELVDILDSRVVHGLVSARVEDGVIEYIADIAAGDARRAIALLRQAALAVEKRYVRTLSMDVVDDVIEDASEAMRDHRVRSLGTHHRLLLQIIAEADEIDGETLHARYEARAQSPKSRSTRRRYLTSLEQYNLIKSDGSTQDTRYRSLCSLQ